MSAKTGIGWTDRTSNAVIGCSRESEGCRYCYAELLAATRLKSQPRYKGLAVMRANGEPQWAGKTRIIQEELVKLLRLKKSHRIFLTSMGDPFHESLSDAQIDLLFGYMRCAVLQSFQLLTKRTKRMLAYLTAPDIQDRLQQVADQIAKEQGLPLGMQAPWPLANVWLGTSIEDQPTADLRVPLLLQCPAALRWVSAEPLLGPVLLDQLNGSAPFDMEGANFYNALSGNSYWINGDHGTCGPSLDWVVSGGESGRKSRCPHPAWFMSLRDQCWNTRPSSTPFFFKQWGTWTTVERPIVGDTSCHFLLDKLLRPTVVRTTLQESAMAMSLSKPNEVFMRRIPKKKAGNLLEGRHWEQLPEDPNPHFISTEYTKRFKRTA